MKGIVVKEPGLAEVTDLPELEPGRYQVLVEHLYGAVCAGTDRHLIKGNLPIPGIEYPLILGHETIGRVLEVGPGVTSFKTGDLITRTGHPGSDGLKAFWGGFTEYGLATDGIAMREAGEEEETWSAHMIHQRLPVECDPAAATMMITWRETWSYITRMGVKARVSVLVLGSGGNGFSFAALAKCLDADQVVMVGNPQWSALAEKVGLDGFVDYRHSDVAGALKAIAPEGFDFIIDAIGQTGGLEQVIDLLQPGGRIGIYGIENLGERMSYLQQLTEQGIDARGPGDYSEAEAHDAVVELLVNGNLDASIWFDLSDPFSLSDFPSAIDAINNKASLKALIKLSSD